MNIVQVDVVDAEPLPRAVEGLADMGRAIVEEARAVVASANGELGRERHPGAPAFVFGQELADHLSAGEVTEVPGVVVGDQGATPGTVGDPVAGRIPVGPEGKGGPRLIPLTVPEVRTLLLRVVWDGLTPAEYARRLREKLITIPENSKAVRY